MSKPGSIICRPAGLSDFRLKPGSWAVDAAHGLDDVWLAIIALMKFVRSFLKYEPFSTHVHIPMDEVIKNRRGVCQDFAHLLIGL